jgi:signal transduction histidine kinase
VTTPIVVLLAFVTTRRLARRVTDRLDGVVVAAHRMTSENLGDRLPVSPAGDADALSVALGNLVGNAIAHSPRGGVIDVAARRTGAAIELVVADQGPGVPQADRERIFLPFARGVTAADRGGADGGVGLGLSVARRIVEAHRGELRVDDAPGGGARFTARLPAA